MRSAPPLRASAKFAARNLDHYWHEILGAVQLEIIDLHRDGELRDGIAQHQRVFELPLFFGRSELAEGFAGEVALAIIELGGQAVVQRNLDAAELAIRALLLVA